MAYGVYVKMQFIHTVNGDVSKTAKIIKKRHSDHTNIVIQAMLVWLIMPFKNNFCGSWTVAVNSVYTKLQFLKACFVYFVL